MRNVFSVYCLSIASVLLFSLNSFSQTTQTISISPSQWGYGTSLESNSPDTYSLDYFIFFGLYDGYSIDFEVDGALAPPTFSAQTFNFTLAPGGVGDFVFNDDYASYEIVTFTTSESLDCYSGLSSFSTVVGVPNTVTIYGEDELFCANDSSSNVDVIVDSVDLVISVQSNSPGTISVTNANFDQVVQNPSLAVGSIDAVAGKSASFDMTLLGANLSSASGTVAVNVLNSAGSLVSSSAQIPVSAIVANGGSYHIPPNEMSSFILASAGSTQLTIQVNTSNATNVTGGTNTLPLNVHSITAPKIAFAEINQQSTCATLVGAARVDCIALPSATNVVNIQNTTGPFISSAYPVPDSSYPNSTFSAAPSVVMGVNSTLLSNSVAEALDAANLSVKATTAGLTRLVGIVSSSYFHDHGAEQTGVFYPILPKAVLVSELDYASIPHELAHSFGQSAEGYCDSTTGCAGGIPEGSYLNWPVVGYDATTGNSYTWNPYANPNFPDSIAAFSIMDGDDELPPGIPVGASPIPLRSSSGSYFYWMDNNTYNILLQKITPLSAIDPQTILVSGVLTSKGQFVFGQSINLLNGNLTSNVLNGDFAINILDSSGSVLSSLTQQSNYTAIVQYAPGQVGPSVVNKGAMPVVVQLPANSPAESIQVSQNGKVIATTSLHAQLLQGIINAIPLSAFKEPRKCKYANNHSKQLTEFCDNYATIEESILNNLVNEIQKVMNSKHPESAIGLLDHLVREVRRFTSDDYAVANPSELTQGQVIEQIKQIASTLEKRKGDCENRQKAKR